MSQIFTRGYRKTDGDTNWEKQLDTIQLVLQNVNGIPNNMKGDIKLDFLHSFMLKNNIDILALMELNMAWDQMEYKDCLPAKTCSWWEVSQWSFFHNKQDTYGDDFQPSGTAILTMNKLSHKMTKLGDDTSGLGRWCWRWLHGKENHFLCIVSLYCPCKVDGHLTMYQQHVWWFSRQGKMSVHETKSWLISQNK